ncbi:MAG: ClpXP protease specificity-enhancing factor, partial [Moraxellaceae bacterium]
LGIYGRENGQGMMFELDVSPPPPPSPPVPPKPGVPTSGEGTVTPIKRPSLKVVK